MPIWLYILLGILLFLAFLLFFPVFCRITYKESPIVDLEILFFRFRLYPRKNKIKAPSHKKQKTKKEDAKKPKAPSPSDPPLKQLTTLLSVLKENFPRLLTVLTLRLKRLKMKVASEDAAKTALLYGEASLALSAFLELLHGFCKFKEDAGAVSLEPDFSGSHTSLDAVLLLSTSLWRVASLGIRLCFGFLKKKRDKKKATPQPSEKNA